MRMVVALSCLFALTIAAAGQQIPKACEDWLTLAKSKIDTLPDNMDKADLLVGVASVHNRLGNRDQAANFLSQAIDIDKGCKDVPTITTLLSIARLRFDMGDDSGCKDALVRAEAKVAGLDGDMADRAWSEIGAVYLSIGDNKAADRIAAKVSVKHTWAQELHSLAMMLIGKSDLPRAIDAITRAKDNAMQDHLLRSLLEKQMAEIQALRGEWASARKTADGIGIPGTKVQAFVEIAEIAYKSADKKQWEDSIKHAQKLTENLEAGLDRTWALQALARAFAEARQWDKAVAKIEELPQGNHRATRWADLASCQIKAGEKKTAMSSLEKAMQSHKAAPPNPETMPDEWREMKNEMILARIGKRYAEAGEMSQAIEIFHKLKSPHLKSAVFWIANEPAVAKQGEALLKFASKQTDFDAARMYVSAASALAPKPKTASAPSTKPESKK